MDDHPKQDPIGVARGSLLRIDDGAGALVHVWEGELWLTQEGSPQDHLLGAGQTFRIDRDGATLVHALQRSLVSLSRPAPRLSSLRHWAAKVLAPLTRTDPVTH